MTHMENLCGSHRISGRNHIFSIKFKMIFSCGNCFGRGSGEYDFCRTVCGDGNIKAPFSVLFFPAAFHPTIDAVVSRLGMGKRTAGMGRNDEAIFTIHPDTAHGVKKLLHNCTLGVVVERSNAAL